MRQNNHKRRTLGALIAALALSALAHVSAVLLAPSIDLLRYDPRVARYSARLTEPLTAAHAEPLASPPPPARAKPRVRSAPAPVPAAIVLAEAEAEPVAIIQRAEPQRTDPSPAVKTPEPSQPSTPPQAPEPELVAAASPTAAVTPKSTGKPLSTLPARISIEYELKSSLADGRAEYVWKRDDNRYEIDSSVEASGFLATMFVGRIEQNSQGAVTEMGLKPARFSLKRGEMVAETADFQWTAKRIRHQRARGEHVQDLTDNAQDLLSFVFQFAYEFPEKLVTPGRVTFSITNARKMDKYEFRVVGNERIDLPMGRTNTVHVIRQTADPTETYEAWLDRDRHYLPVKLRFMLGGRVQVEQVAVSLNTTP